jgi:DNA-binding transcriptional MerR regulator
MTEHNGERRQTYSITQLRREFDVTARTLRFYEDKGLLEPARDGQTRLYSHRDRARLKLILLGKRVGFSLADIKEILDLYNLKDGRFTQMRVSLEKGRDPEARYRGGDRRSVAHLRDHRGHAEAT